MVRSAPMPPGGAQTPAHRSIARIVQPEMHDSILHSTGIPIDADREVVRAAPVFEAKGPGVLRTHQAIVHHVPVCQRRARVGTTIVQYEDRLGSAGLARLICSPRFTRRGRSLTTDRCRRIRAAQDPDHRQRPTIALSVQHAVYLDLFDSANGNPAQHGRDDITTTQTPTRTCATSRPGVDRRQSAHECRRWSCAVRRDSILLQGVRSTDWHRAAGR